MGILPPLRIGNLVAEVPIIQGGMGVRISTSALAAAVANEGGIGVIASVALGFNYPDRKKLGYFKANKKALAEELRKARSLTKGIIGVNAMVAITDYADMVRVSVENGADLIISGAGLPLNLPELVEGYDVKLLPIVSSLRALKVIFKKWEKKYSRIPDGVVVETPNKAAGHLGVQNIDDVDSQEYSLEHVIPEIVRFIGAFDPSIPVIAAGGIWDNADIHKALEYGAAGVQMGTRFVCTHEAEASEKFKQCYVNASKEDVVLVKSPLGLPGRALNNKFVQNLSQTPRSRVKCMARCLYGCNPKTTPFCIVAVLDHAQRGNLDEGLIFAGTNAYKVDKIVSVKELMDELKTEKSSD